MTKLKDSNNAKVTSNIIGTDIMRKKMGEVLDCVYFRSDEFIIERKHKPLAALIPIEKYNSLNKLARELLAGALSNYTNPNISSVEADNLANEAKHSVRNQK